MGLTIEKLSEDIFCMGRRDEAKRVPNLMVRYLFGNSCTIYQLRQLFNYAKIWGYCY